MAENDTLSAPQKRAVAALLSERDTRAAAKAAGVSERSLWRWLSDPLFRAELARSEGELIDQATRRLVALQSDALAAFENILGSTTAGDHAKLRAAEGVLGFLLKLRELRTMEERLTILEEAIYAKNET